MAILECFSPENAELAVTEVSARLGMPKSTVSRLLQTMAGQGLVEQDEGTRRYRVGPLPFRLGQLYYAHVKVAELVETAHALIQAKASDPLLVSITSPLNLLKELFTVKGAGTLIKPGTAVERRDSYAETDVTRLGALLEASFGRALEPSFFSRPPLAVYLESNYRGAAILLDEAPAPYLSKFAVEPEAQGEGIGNDLWQAMQRDFPRLFWRGRPENPVTPWYQSVCDGMVRLPNWNLFWRGIAPEQIPHLIAYVEALSPDFGAPREG